MRIGAKSRSVLESDLGSRDDDDGDRADWRKWEKTGGTYTDLVNTTVNMCHGRHALLDNRTDHSTLATGVPRLSNLDIFRVVMTVTIDPVLEHFTSGWKESVLRPHPAFCHHLFVTMDALRAARIAGVNVKTFQCEGNMPFLPYDGFGPFSCACGCQSERSEQMQLAAAFSTLKNGAHLPM